jgi:hypothetical protein
MPFASFIGETSEGKIILFGVGSMRSESGTDYEWLLESFYDCYKSLPSTWITDGDSKNFNAIMFVAKSKFVVVLFLCEFHHIIYSLMAPIIYSKNYGRVQFDC